MVDVALGGHGRADPFADDLRDDHDAFASVLAEPNLVTGPDQCAGLTRAPLTLTCPARQSLEAAERVLASRTDQIQLSTRPV